VETRQSRVRPFSERRESEEIGNGLALNFSGQPRIRSVHRLTALMTGLPAATAGMRHGLAAQIAETGEMLHEFGSTNLEVL
jgi:hypothetical protein